MSKQVKKKAKQSLKSGLPPGTLVHTGIAKSVDAKITVIEYNSDSIHEYEVETFLECPQANIANTVTWVNVDGVHEIELIEELEKKYGLHPLVLEDIVNTVQRPKLEDYGNYFYIVLKNLNKKDRAVTIEQISLILLPGLVISFQENTDNNIFVNIKNRLLTNKGKLRVFGADFLVYSLIDSIVDSYFSIMEELSENIENLEDETEANPHPDTLKHIHQLKREVILYKKIIWPLREVITSFERSSETFTSSSTKIYLRDVYDHIINLLDMLESSRDMLSGLFDVYLSSVSNKTNEVMKLLTVIGTIFIPLTFITSLYGMNFKFMPELEWKYGYFIIVGLMILIGSGMAIFFRKRKWI